MFVGGNTRSSNHLSAGQSNQILTQYHHYKVINLEKLAPFINEVSTHSKQCVKLVVAKSPRHTETLQGDLTFLSVAISGDLGLQEPDEC